MTSAAEPGLESHQMEALMAAWKKIFLRPSVGVNENFFELGGDASLAAALASEISRTIEREISPVLILHAPTIASLYAILQGPTPFFLPTVNPLRKGQNDTPPVLLFHGCAGTVLDIVKLAHSIRASNPIYGLQNPGTDGLTKALERIEDIAQYHFEALKQLKIKGPYLLIGYSAGGLVALELANRLKEIGDKVALLVMIDSFLPLSGLPRHRLLRVKLRRESHRWGVAVGHSLTSTSHPEKQPPDLAASVGCEESMRRFRQAERQALESYRGHYYDGQIRFIRAKASWAFPLNPQKMWSPFTPNMTVETTRGDHVGLISTHYSDLGTILSRYIDKALP